MTIECIANLFSTTQSTLEQWIRYFFSTFLSRLWFLPLIFCLYLVTPLFRVFVKHASRRDLVYCFFLWFLIASLLPFIYPSPLFPTYEPSLLLVPFQYAGYFIAGYFVVTTKYFQNINRLTLRVLLAIPLLLIPLLANISSTKIFVERFLSPGAAIAAVSSFILLWYFSHYLEKRISPIVKKTIALLSSASLGIYVLHEIIVFILSKNIPSLTENSVTQFFLAAIIFIISAAMVLIFKRIPLIKYIVP